MSRLIVKNLPKTVTEQKLRTLFSEKGDITDIQLKYTPDGTFRRFGFIGYRTEEQAEAAIKYFHNSCIKASRITVEHCASLGDEKKPKSWSKYAPDSKINQKESEKEKGTDSDSEETPKQKSKKDKAKKINEILEKYKDDSMFDEFMQTHLKNDKTIWKNDVIFSSKESEQKSDDNVDEDKLNSDDEEEQSEDKLANKDISDIEYMKNLMPKSTSTDEIELPPPKPRQHTEKKVKEKIQLFTLKLKNLPYNVKKKDLKQFFNPIVPYTIRLPRNAKCFAYVGFKKEKDFNKALIKDRSFLSGKRITVIKYTTKVNDDNTDTEINTTKKKWANQEETLKNEESIAESGRIFIRNLSYTTTEDDIQKLFEKYGPLAEVSLPIDKTTRQPKGFGVIAFLMPEHAAKAFSELDGSILNGRMVHLLPAKSPVDNTADTENLSYKEKKMLMQKKQASSSHNWNTLFVRHDAVADVVAGTYATTKSKVLGTEPGENNNLSAAVRLALGETQIVQDIQNFLEENGVCLEAFNGVPVRRSKTVIIIKNLPANTTYDEISQLFEPFGVLCRVILPPNGITALVEFMEPFEARNAFTKLAYSKFKNVPLYLEWGPENSFKTPGTKIHTKETVVVENLPKIENNVTNVENEGVNAQEHKNETNNEDEENDEEPEENTTLFVKNLSFNTTEESMKKHFEYCGKLHYVSIVMKKDPKNPGRKLSMGYGFVRYMYQDDAEKALKVLQMTTLDGKSLELKRSERTLQSDTVNVKKKTTKATEQTGTKILVRNIPFQANKNEVMDLFKTFGEIKALRLPKKMTIGASNNHRGFAFVDYQTKTDAKKAFKALSQSTHLYGRRLVLEWAANETEDVSVLQKRTAAHFASTTKTHQLKKSVLEIDPKEKDADD